MNKAEVQNLNQKLQRLHLLRIEDEENPNDGIELIFGDASGADLFKLSLAYGAGDVWHKLTELGDNHG